MTKLDRGVLDTHPSVSSIKDGINNVTTLSLSIYIYIYIYFFFFKKKKKNLRVRSICICTVRPFTLVYIGLAFDRPVHS